MSKYIIDLPDNCSWVQWVMTSDKDGHAYFDFKSPEDLTTLDKELDDSYQKGLEEGKKQAKVQAHLDVCHDIERVAHGNYQKGLDDAWECAKRIALVKIDKDCPYFTVTELKKIFGYSTLQSVFDTYSASEAIEKVKAYEKQQKADAEIKVGDEVRNTSGLMDNAVGYVIGTTIEGDYNVSRHIDGKIKTGTWRKENCVKTGKHSDTVVQLLAEMEGSTE